ncbi:hypothetical protein GCM10009628_11100 [Paeniglutamicibacter kerguelensis]
MESRESNGCRMVVEIIQPDRLGFVNQDAKDTVTGGQRSYSFGQFGLYPLSDEMAHFLALANDPQCTVLGIHKLARRLNHMLKNCSQAQFLGNGNDRRQ